MLELFFKEPSKMDQQECFKRLYANMKNHESSEHAEIEKLQDGAIIGNGRSDFTLETKSYTFKHNNQSFVLLDVPGIEGDEKKLNSKFLTLQEKPMLFFMLQKHPLLRKKEKREKRERLKRSKANLIRKQRYIPYTINQSRALKDGLIDANEKESLKILNEKMKAILGKHYEGHQIVSAQAAFYGLSSALLPETDFYKNKQKFLEFFKAEELLLYKSQFKQFRKIYSRNAS